MLRILYLVHDLADPAVSRRIAMLIAGGAEVTVAGFRRTAQPVVLGSVNTINLGVTQDGRFIQRITATAFAAFGIAAALKAVSAPDVIIARNLEMLALAQQANRHFSGRVPIVYECLDIHRLLLRRDLVGQTIRRAEDFFSKDVRLLITSSPAFVENYFRHALRNDIEIEIVENKVLETGADGPASRSVARQPGPPWRVGWFGALRCRRSLDLLAAFSREMEGAFEVVIRGRPAYREIPDFDDRVAAERHLTFHGAYRNPEDLAAIYGDIHFTWAIDFFEAGENSDWLLPNRLYEGCLHGAVPVAMERTETGRFLEQRGIGIRLGEPTVEELCRTLGAADPGSVEEACRIVAAIDPRTWACSLEDCRALIAKLSQVASKSTGKLLKIAA